MEDVIQVVVEDLLKLKEKYVHLDCVVFFSFKDGFHIYDEIDKLPGNLSFDESKYEGYNTELEGYEWNNIYREISRHLSQITDKYGDDYRILIDLKEKEVRVVVEEIESEIVRF